MKSILVPNIANVKCCLFDVFGYQMPTKHLNLKTDDQIASRQGIHITSKGCILPVAPLGIVSTATVFKSDTLSSTSSGLRQH